MTVETTNAKFPKKTKFLWEPHRYKVLYGGRGSAKSWSFARTLLALARRRKLFVLHGREFQSSIRDSVHKLLADQIHAMDWTNFYTIKDTEIVGDNGSQHVFYGIRNNINSLKSIEAIDIAAIYEANNASKNSWDVLLPTVRRDAPFGPFDQGSEIWVEFNPELDTDETYKRWVLNPPIDCVSVEMNWQDNPFFPEILKAQKDEAYRRDPDDARTIWGGKTRKTLKGAIFAKELETAINEDRVSNRIKADMTKPVDVSFDLGDSDMCAFWCWQQFGMEHNAVDYYGNTGHGMDHYLDVLQERKYKIRHILLPHDAAQAHQSARGNKLGNTIEKQVRAVHEGKVRMVPRTSVVNRINATRNLFPRINFAEGPTAAGVQGLTHYQYKIDDRGQRSREPHHNWASNPADAFSYYPVWLKEGSTERPKRDVEHQYYEPNSQGWMA